jgi:D-alanyl-lipoteichoic acid acyltransferase DltB (MBOAT superfamily)
MWLKIRNTFIIFIVSGFWHGANWTFIAWGFLNALFIMPSIILNTNRNYLDIVAKGKYFPTVKEFLAISLTFALTVFAWIFFRAESIGHAFSYIGGIFSKSLFTIPLLDLKKISMGAEIIYTFILILGFISVEWLQRDKQHALQFINNKSIPVVRWSIYYGLMILIIFFQGNQQNFIYFQF